MLKLISYLFTGFTGVFTLFIAALSRKTVVSAASILAVVGLTTIFLSTINSLTSSFVASLVMPPFLNYFLWFVPSNFSACMAFIIAAHISRAAYDLLITKVQIINAAS